MQLTVEAIAGAVGGSVTCPDGTTESTVCDGATQDSRVLSPGQLFVPIIADRDGHDYVPDAVAAGAAAYLTSRGPVAGGTETVPRVEVDDTEAALGRLGVACRWRLSGTVVGVTGSVGKTTVKDLVAAACAPARSVHASPASFNNEIGVPLTLVNAPPDTDLVVVEMGARDIGHIARLCDIARPDVGVVTAVGAAHTEIFGSVAQVAEAKGELIEALPPDGLAVLSSAQPEVRSMARRTIADAVYFGEGGDVVASDVTVEADLSTRFTVDSPWGTANVVLGARGRHNVDNALAALAVAGWSGVPIEVAAAALAEPTLSPQRMDVVELPGGLTVINDVYNANPMSMHAALESLAALGPGDGTRRVAVLGIMAELGPAGAAAHREVAAMAGDAGIDVIAYGTDAYGVEAAADPAEVVERIGELDERTVLLVKGSRVARLEEVVEAIRAADDRW